MLECWLCLYEINESWYDFSLLYSRFKTVVAVAQLVESRIVIPVVVGSSPIGHPKILAKSPPLSGGLFAFKAIKSQAITGSAYSVKVSSPTAQIFKFSCIASVRSRNSAFKSNRHAPVPSSISILTDSPGASMSCPRIFSPIDLYA